MRNTLGDLNNHLFAQLERLSDEDLKGEKLSEEINRAKAVTGVASQIIANGSLVLEAQKIMDDRFGTDLKINQLRSFIKNKGLKSGLSTRFKKGQKPWNTGMNGLLIGGKDSRFKKGHKPHNYMPVGSERVNGEGYIDIKIADPGIWKGKHKIIWEKTNGPIPKGHAVIFGDGNRQNFDLNNLILVSRKQLAVLNRKGLIQNDADLTRTGVIMADIYMKINERKKDKKGGFNRE